MNIGLISYEFPSEMATGGIGTYMFHLATLLTGSGHRVVMFSGTLQDGCDPVVERENCTNYLIKAADNPEFREKVVPVFKRVHSRLAFDIIESPETGACALAVKQTFPEIPLVVGLHTPGVLITRVNNTYLPLHAKLRYILGALKRGRFDLGYWAAHDKNYLSDPEYQICILASHITSASEALRSWAVSFWRLPPDKIRVVPNPFHLEEETGQDLYEKKEDMILFVGKLSLLKGMVNFTKAIPAILKKHPGHTLVLVGRDEPLGHFGASTLQYMQEHLGPYVGRITFTGALPPGQVRQLFRKASICVFPSLWENYPNVILEAMSCSCAVVASNKGGIPEIIRNRENGLLINPHKPQDIAKRVCQLIEDPRLRQKISRNALHFIRDRFSGEHGHEVGRIYKELSQ